MSYMTGSNGSLSIKNTNIDVIGGSKSLARVKNWTMSLNHSPLDTTCLGDYDSVYTGGLRNYEVSGTMLYYQETSSNFTQMLQNMLGGTLGTGDPNDKNYGATGKPEPELIRLYLAMQKGTAESSDFTVYGYLTAFSVTCATGEVVSADFTVQVHGKPSNVDLK